MTFRPGVDPVPVSGKVLDADDLHTLHVAVDEVWLTAGPWTERFEAGLAKVFGLRHALMVNSGSSANLLALSALTSPELGSRRLKPGHEVITCAVGFPTTVNPILQNGLMPVFVDCDRTYNLDVNQLEDALSSRTSAVIAAHTLGCPFDAWAVADFCHKHGLWLIEDCCDALGATFAGRSVGTFGDFATCSFYPAHHITTGEGGAVLTGQAKLAKLAESFRDWGRSCWCAPGKDNTCGKRWDWDVEGLPYGYDHKHVFAHVGYNLKATDLQAAVGVSQLKKLPGFIEARRRNWLKLWEGMRSLMDFFVLPERTPNAEPSWFGFALMVREDAPFSRLDVTRWLDSRKIATRPLFGGNLTRQPAYAGHPYRIVSDLANANAVMERVFWLGCWPGLTGDMLGYVLESLHEFCREAT